MNAEYVKLIESAQVSGLTFERGTEDMGVGIVMQLRDSSGVPYTFHCYVPYEAPGGVDTEIEKECKNLLDAFIQHVDIQVYQDVDGSIDGGLILTT